MGQHFLLSARARTLSIAKIVRMSDDEAYRAFCAIRWAETEGQPVCIRCSCAAVYEIKTRRKFKCQNCLRQFSVTSGTIFASHKLDFRTLLWAISIYTNGAKGYSALQLSRDLDVQYKTASIFLKKIREAVAALQRAQFAAGETMKGDVEVDGGYFGGYVKQANLVHNRVDRRRLENRSGPRQCVVVIRERNGRSLPFVGKAERDALPTIKDTVHPGSILFADAAPDYDELHSVFDFRRVNHDKEGFTNEDGVSSNWAESWLSRARRMEIGTHHHIAGAYLDGHVSEVAWREDNRRLSNGEQFLILASAALHHPVSRQWKGYWQWRADDGLNHNRPRPKLKRRRNFSPQHVRKPWHISRTTA